MLLEYLYVRAANDTERNFGLDLLRAIAICLVLIAHGHNFFPVPAARSLILYDGGFLGVELFFVLSGFLIGSILLKLFGDPRAKPNLQTVANFWLRRWFRTLPNYFLFLCLNILAFLWLHGFDNLDIAKYWFFLQNFAWPMAQLMPESWSLTIEEWFYLLFPLVLLAFVYLPFKRKQMILAGLVFYLLVSTAVRFLGAAHFNFSWDEGFRKIVIYRLDSIGYGVLLAYMNFFHKRILDQHSRFMLFVGSLITLLSIVIISNSVQTTMETQFNKTALFTLTSIGLALVLPWFMALKVSNRLACYAITHISIVSYSMYLVHTFVLHLTDILSPGETLPWFLPYGAYLLLTLIMATIIYKFYEHPMTSLRNRVTTR